MLPDFFADDVVIDAAKLRTGRAELPSENFLVHLTGAGDCLAVSVFENKEQEVRVTLAGEGAQRTITGSEIRFSDSTPVPWAVSSTFCWAASRKRWTSAPDS